MTAKVGDVVTLISEPQIKMTIAEIDGRDEGSKYQKATCHWFVGGVLHTARFPIEALRVREREGS